MGRRSSQSRDAGLSDGLRALSLAFGSETPEMAIRGACQAVLRSCGLKEPPIALRPLFKKLGVSYIPSTALTQGKAIASLEVGSGGQLQIRVHESNNTGELRRRWRRLRFSLAHELGHAIIYRALGDDPALIASLDQAEDGYARLERVCDIAAQELLMPAPVVRQSLRQADLSPSNLLHLYDLFLVSRDVLVRRVAEFIPFGGVTRWRRFSRTSQEPVCFRVWSGSQYAPEESRPWLPRGCTLSHLDPPIIEWVAERHVPICQDRVLIHRGKHSQECVALATFFPPREVVRTSLPLFGSQEVADDGFDDPTEVTLFVADAQKSGGHVPWKLNAGSAQFVQLTHL